MRWKELCIDKKSRMKICTSYGILRAGGYQPGLTEESSLNI
jgi:hypothetical protein